MEFNELLKATYAMFRPPRAQTVSEWADANRVLVSESSAEPGPWRTDRAPYQREIMDAFTQPGVYEIVIMSSSQVGKSEIELNMMGRAIDNDPGPMLYVQPTDKVAEDYSKRRIAPMIAACPPLRDKVYKAKGRDAANTITMKTFPGGSLAIIGANSPSDLASKPVRYIFLDEIDRFPPSAGTEGDPIELAERRTETYRHNRKIVKTSTPTIKGVSKIEKAYMKGTQEEWHTECPHCRGYSFIRFDDVKWDTEKFKDEDGETNYIVKNPRWQCPVCKTETPEHEVKRLPAKWVVKNAKALANGIRSFRMNAFMSPWSDWREIALSFLHAKDDPELLKVFHNTMLGESWELRDRSGVPEKLYERREHYNAEVPSGVLVLTMGIDTQDNRLEYEVVGWDRHEESWGIERGVIPGRADSPGVWEEVDALLDREWKMKNGMALRVLATFIDSGGHFTQDIYRECARRASRRIWPVKGEGGAGKLYVRQMKSGTGIRGAYAFMIGVDVGKEAILYSTGLEEAGARYMHFPIEPRAGYDLEYFRGLVSERQVIHRRAGQSVVAWEKIHERNEPLDMRNYARAAYMFFHWNFDKIEAALRGEDTTEKITKAEAERRKPKRVISAGIKV
jgi:phage terminase large subunit GpA-like protein